MSTSATCASIERLRWTMPMPPSRASAIARRASVTVSMAAETIGIARSIEGVSRARVETSFGRTCDSAGTSSTSSKVSPSRANFRSSSSSRWTSSALSSAAACSVKKSRVTSSVDNVLTGRSYRLRRAVPGRHRRSSPARRHGGRGTSNGTHPAQERGRPDRGDRAEQQRRRVVHVQHQQEGVQRGARPVAGQARPDPSPARVRKQDLHLEPRRRTAAARASRPDLDRALDAARDQPVAGRLASSPLPSADPSGG